MVSRVDSEEKGEPGSQGGEESSTPPPAYLSSLLCISYHLHVIWLFRYLAPCFYALLFLTQYLQAHLSPFHRQVVELFESWPSEAILFTVLLPLSLSFPLRIIYFITHKLLFHSAFILLLINCSSRKFENEGENVKTIRCVLPL